jgi:hypothetical protein
MAGYPYFAFVDESGVLSADPNQPFFAIGMLLIKDCSKLYQVLNRIRGNAIATLGAVPSSFEFHFNSITNLNRTFYEQLLDAWINEADIRTCVFVLDKTDPRINPHAFFPSIWDAYISYTQLLVRNNVPHSDAQDECVIIADYLNKPVSSPRYFESEMRAVPSVLNATMLESRASLFIQLIDLIAGAVVYDFRRAAETPHTSSPSKIAVNDYLRGLVREPSLARDLTVNTPVYFSVWRFTP